MDGAEVVEEHPDAAAEIDGAQANLEAGGPQEREAGAAAGDAQAGRLLLGAYPAHVQPASDVPEEADSLARRV